MIFEIPPTAARTAPRSFQYVPRSPRDVPKSFQDVPRPSQNHFETVSRPPQDVPKPSQDPTETAEDPAQNVPTPFKITQTPPRTPKNPQEPPKKHKFATLKRKSYQNHSHIRSNPLELRCGFQCCSRSSHLSSRVSSQPHNIDFQAQKSQSTMPNYYRRITENVFKKINTLKYNP